MPIPAFNRSRHIAPTQAVIPPLIFFILFSCTARGSSRRVPWEKNQPYVSDLFNLIPEPGITDQEIMRSISEAERIVRALQRDFFPVPLTRRINVILYKNQRSYSMYRRVPFDSLADFERREFRINVPLNAPPLTWKHELSHALLESARPLSPFWLHEGLALFIQETNFDEKISCSREIPVSMPQNLRSYLPELRDREDLFSGDRFKTGSSDSFEFHTGLAGYFIFYLWHQKRLHRLLLDYQKGNRYPEWHLIHGNSVKWRSLMQEFHSWIRSEYPIMALPGC